MRSFSIYLVITEVIKALPNTNSVYNAKNEHCNPIKRKEGGKKKCQE